MRGLITKSFSTRPLMTGENLAEFLQSDLAFHMTIIEAAVNPATDEIDRLAPYPLCGIFGVERFGHKP